ncbi:ethylbenzene dehydrogenase-related protein [Photobacterium atrarenae]|uniref:Ethylbenzene dehydrogenase-related protein n=1 Tax=Photobacterium atrarenae TaxID=865757 RepID=A0ABY5GMQ7_9GAMM|nr:ethylbenzene dehydrogenase-related protein [Photobacterium atrarenae]UTV29994.1 ethylbenzene dehydrogenase-related protein [Photobacterium atrarenae]
MVGQLSVFFDVLAAGYSRAATRCVLVLAGVLTAWSAGAADTLVSVRVKEPIKLDGVAESVWLKATPLTVVLDQRVYQPRGESGITSTSVSVQSLYDDEHVYFFIQWDDPTRSLAFMPWEKQPDGRWQRLMSPDQFGYENTYHEDKLSLYWNINTQGFDTQGCAIACHMADSRGYVADVEQSQPGRKFTAREDETLDAWVWRAVRTGKTVQADDQYVDATIDPAANLRWGLKGDFVTGGGYQENMAEATQQPVMGDRVWDAVQAYALGPQQQVPLVDTFSSGDRLASVLVSPFTGSRGDISAQSNWKDGKWLLELKRKRVTAGHNAKVQDVQFSELSQTYYFGLAVFDNAQMSHLYSPDVFRMKFAPLGQ